MKDKREFKLFQESWKKMSNEAKSIIAKKKKK